MSLRDQLLAKGLVSKKKAKRVGRELKEDRKRRQGERRKKREVQAERAAAEAAEAEAVQAQQLADRKRREQEHERMERALRIRQILTSNRIDVRGKVAFHHFGADRRTIHRIHVSERAAFSLRNGELGVAALGLATDRPTFVVLPRTAIDRLYELAPRTIVFHVQDTEGLSDPALAILPTTADGDLRAHRARPEDLAATISPASSRTDA